MSDEQLREWLVNASIQEQLDGRVQSFIAQLSAEQVRYLFSQEKIESLREELKNSLNNLLTQVEEGSLKKNSNLENEAAFINLSNVSKFLVLYFLAQKAMPGPAGLESAGQDSNAFKKLEAELQSVSAFKQIGFNVYDLFKS